MMMMSLAGIVGGGGDDSIEKYVFALLEEGSFGDHQLGEVAGAVGAFEDGRRERGPEFVACGAEAGDVACRGAAEGIVHYACESRPEPVIVFGLFCCFCFFGGGGGGRRGSGEDGEGIRGEDGEGFGSGVGWEMHVRHPWGVQVARSRGGEDEDGRDVEGGQFS